MEKNLANLTAAMEFCDTLSSDQREYLFTVGQAKLYEAACNPTKRMSSVVTALNQWSGGGGRKFHMTEELGLKDLKTQFQPLCLTPPKKIIRPRICQTCTQRRRFQQRIQRKHDAAAVLETLKGASMLMDLSTDSNPENPYHLEIQANSLSKFIPRRRHHNTRAPVVQKNQKTSLSQSVPSEINGCLVKHRRTIKRAEEERARMLS
ncbi:hypothetical protein T439DRAFT_336538 [Meredithblackwellia eburnea MCA 4105]